jgi:hypothetical protein
VKKGSESWSASTKNKISGKGSYGPVDGNGGGSFNGNIKYFKFNDNTSL